MQPGADKPILEVDSLQVKFPVRRKTGTGLFSNTYVTAVKNVSFRLYEGEVYGLVGESGSGKSTTGRTMVRLTPASSGQVLYRNQDILKLSEREFRKFRKDIQFVFQDPFSSLNPRKRIGEILEEPLIIHRIGNRARRKEQVFRILKTVGLQPEYYFRFPHECSGGQRQRLGLARAIILNPKIIICDEPVSALDVSIQSQILNMLKQLQQELKLTLFFITHDISVVRYISDRIGVMYLGTIVEEALTDDLFQEPLHPYTRALLSAVPDFIRGQLRERIVLKGEMPSPLSPPSGCVFHTRCLFATEKCKAEEPALKEVQQHHFVACHHI